jgi:hypothetical protein
MEDLCMAAKKDKGSDKAPKDLKPELLLTGKEGPSEQELQREADSHRAFKSIFSKNVIGLSIGGLGLGDGDPRWDNVIVVDDLTYEYSSEIQPPHLVANLYQVAVKEGTEAPPWYAESAFNLVLVQFDEVFRPIDQAKYFGYLASIFRNYCKDFNDHINTRFTIILGNSNAPKNTFEFCYGISHLKPTVFDFRDTDKEELFKRLQSCKDKGIAAERLDILRLLMLQMPDSLDFELLTQQIELGTALLINSDRGVSDFLRGIVELEWHKLSFVERNSILSNTAMTDYIADWLTDAKVEAKVEGKAKGIEETLTRNVISFIEKGYSQKVIMDGLQVSEAFIDQVGKRHFLQLTLSKALRR